MLAYAPRADQKALRPATLGLIVLGHVGLLALVMTAKSGILITDPPNRPDIFFLPDPETPKPPPPPRQRPDPKPTDSQIDTVEPTIRTPTTGPDIAQLPQPIPDPGPTIGTGTEIVVDPVDPTPPIVRKGPRIVTSGDDLRPPYPVARREAGDEATLKLRLSIDDRGRVIAVDPVGRADPTFLEAARRHILRKWRYQPAMEGSKAIPSTATITLKFELGNA